MVRTLQSVSSNVELTLIAQTPVFDVVGFISTRMLATQVGPTTVSDRRIGTSLCVPCPIAVLKPS